MQENMDDEYFNQEQVLKK